MSTASPLTWGRLVTPITSARRDLRTGRKGGAVLNRLEGCCVTWWYHVAPLIRVQIKILNIKFTLALVIDPSMFDKPVLLSSWLMAQENAACSANAHVSTYSIQPGSAYTPMFTTDPAYTHTNQTLIDYQNLTTC